MPMGAIIGAGISAGARLLGGAMSNKSSQKVAAMNARMQRDFAQHGIQWRVADAKAAGVHPLYALGAQTHSFQPTAVGDSFDFIGDAGQDIGRAISQASRGEEKVDAYTQQLRNLQLERGRLENDVLRARLASAVATASQGAQPPAPGSTFLIDGQSGSGAVKTSPMARESANPGNTSQEAGTHTEVGFLRAPGGARSVVMSKDAKERLEEDVLGAISWNLRNRLLPSFGFNRNPPNERLPAGYDAWYFNPWTWQYEPGHMTKLGPMPGKKR